jgi:hypothetical protein
LVRSYAIALIPNTHPAVKDGDDGYEPDMEQEKMSIVEDRDKADKADDLETPKKKKKADKPKVRDQIEAQRETLAKSNLKDMEVSCYLIGITVPHASVLV